MEDQPPRRHEDRDQTLPAPLAADRRPDPGAAPGAEWRDPLTRQPLPLARFAAAANRLVERGKGEGLPQHVMVAEARDLARIAGKAGDEQHREVGPEIGRASCRERVCQYV